MVVLVSLTSDSDKDKLFLRQWFGSWVEPNLKSQLQIVTPSALSSMPLKKDLVWPSDRSHELHHAYRKPNDDWAGLFA